MSKNIINIVVDHDHDILLGRMKYVGFTSKIIGWFGSHLKKAKLCRKP